MMIATHKITKQLVMIRSSLTYFTYFYCYSSCDAETMKPRCDNAGSQHHMRYIRITPTLGSKHDMLVLCVTNSAKEQTPGSEDYVYVPTRYGDGCMKIH